MLRTKQTKNLGSCEKANTAHKDDISEKKILQSYVTYVFIPGTSGAIYKDRAPLIVKPCQYSDYLNSWSSQYSCLLDH